MPFRKSGFFHHLLGFQHEDYENLYDASLNVFIQSAWETPEIKNQTSDYFKKYNSSSSEYVIMKNWYKITKNVLDSISNIPYAILKDCQDGVVFVGKEILRWTRYVLDELRLDFSYAETIYWTRHSFIDVEKIFESFWENNQKLWEFDEKCPLGKPIYQLACIFVQEEFILQNAEDMMVQLKRLADFAGSPFRVVKHENKFHEVMNTWLAFYIDGIISHASKNHQNFNVNNFPYGFYTALNKCRELRFSHVANYIINCSKNQILGENFNSLKSADLINYCDSFCKDTFSKYLYYEKSCEDFYLKLLDDVLLCERDEILGNIRIEPKFNILQVMLKAWPYRRYCQPYFERVILPFYKGMFLEYSPFSCYNDALVFVNKLRHLLNFIAYKSRDDFLCGCPVKGKIYEEILECMWEPIEKSDRKRLIVGGIFLEWYYDCLDFNSLRIINSQCVDKNLGDKKMDQLETKNDCSAGERPTKSIASCGVVKCKKIDQVTPKNDSSDQERPTQGRPTRSIAFCRIVKREKMDQAAPKNDCSAQERLMRSIASCGVVKHEKIDQVAPKNNHSAGERLMQSTASCKIVKRKKIIQMAPKNDCDAQERLLRSIASCGIAKREEVDHEAPKNDFSAQERLMQSIVSCEIKMPIVNPGIDTVSQALASSKISDPLSKPDVKPEESDQEKSERRNSFGEFARPLLETTDESNNDAQLIKVNENGQKKQKPEQTKALFWRPEETISNTSSDAKAFSEIVESSVEFAIKANRSTSNHTLCRANAFFKIWNPLENSVTKATSEVQKNQFSSEVTKPEETKTIKNSTALPKNVEDSNYVI